jgi:hypothetical protein
MSLAEMIELWLSLVAIFVGIRQFLKAKYPRARGFGKDLASRFLFAVAAALCVALAGLELLHRQNPVVPVIVLGCLIAIITFPTGGPKRHKGGPAA